MNKLKVVFIGGLTNGRIVLDYLLGNIHVNVPIVLTHPIDYKVARYVKLISPDVETDIKYNLDSISIMDDLIRINPDFIFVAGWSNILPAKLLAIPKYGTIGFHPSKLPKDRGRSVLAWQIEDGYTETALSMFYYNELPDCGDIIAQERIKIEYNDYIEDVLNKVDYATYNLMKAYFPMLRKGIAPRRKQDINKGNFRRLRSDLDSTLNWDTNHEVLYNKIRAISRPYPGSIGNLDDGKYRIWKAIPCAIPEELRSQAVGKHYRNEDSGLIMIKCRDGCLQLLDYEQM
jgi:methionyl-tRNA formyltransferase